MGYTEQEFRDVVEEFGEVFFVLESDREYEVHGSRSFEIEDGIVEVEGLHDSEYLIVQFPLDSIEHHFTHKEV